jgi:hypothetical protein
LLGSSLLAFFSAFSKVYFVKAQGETAFIFGRVRYWQTVKHQFVLKILKMLFGLLNSAASGK